MPIGLTGQQQHVFLGVLLLWVYVLPTEARPQQSDLFKQIDKDLHHFRNGISIEMVEQVYCSNSDQGFRLQVLGNKLYVAGEIVDNSSKARNRNIKMQLLELSQRHALPDIDVYITTDDWPQVSQQNVSAACPQQGPLLCQAKLDTRPHALLMPDWTFYDWSSEQNPGWADLKYILQAASDDNGWHTRLPKLFFRGNNATGTRSIVAETNLEPYESLDIKAWFWPKHRHEFVSLLDHCKHKYLLNWPGHSYSARLKALLQCGSAVVYPTNGWYEFYYGLLKHGENIVMMNHLEKPSDITQNLTAVVNILKQYDDKARQIGVEGQYVTQNILTPDNIQEYWRRLLTGYAKLMQFEPHLHPDAIGIGKSLTTSAYLGYDLSNRTCSVCVHHASAGVRWDRNQ
ncbi:hypothetical protein ABBQ32_007052 [Trebouxia sp. C0010 RCD-2024]